MMSHAHLNRGHIYHNATYSLNQRTHLFSVMLILLEGMPTMTLYLTFLNIILSVDLTLKTCLFERVWGQYRGTIFKTLMNN